MATITKHLAATNLANMPEVVWKGAPVVGYGRASHAMNVMTRVANIIKVKFFILYLKLESLSDFWIKYYSLSIPK